MPKALKFSGSILEIRRKVLGYSRATLAKKIGCTHEAVWYWEAGKYQPNARFIPKLAKALQLAPEKLFHYVPRLK